MLNPPTQTLFIRATQYICSKRAYMDPFPPYFGFQFEQYAELRLLHLAGEPFNYGMACHTVRGLGEYVAAGKMWAEDRFMVLVTNPGGGG